MAKVPQLSVPPDAIWIPGHFYLKKAFRDRKVAIVVGSIICLVQECGGGKRWVSITIAQLIRGVQAANALAQRRRLPPFMTLDELQDSLTCLHKLNCIHLDKESDDIEIDTIIVTEEMIKPLAPYLIPPR